MPDPKPPPTAAFEDMAERSLDAGIADENAAYTKAMARDAEPGKDEKPAGKAPPAEGRSSEQPAEGGEETAPRQEGSPG